ncbi:MAG TPA: hypothetical protein VGG74_33825 [Kofleriaceae bacterium]|jgi:hypothetical protein
MKWLAIAVMLCACAKHEVEQKPVDPLPPAEVQRARDACQSYVDKACACTAPAAAKECALAKPLPEALDLALQTAASGDEDRDARRRSQVFVRETVKQCVEELAKLPAIGCR